MNTTDFKFHRRIGLEKGYQHLRLLAQTALAGFLSMNNAFCAPQSADALAPAVTVGVTHSPPVAIGPRCETSPAWPAGAKSRQESGTVFMIVRVDAAGTVSQLDIKKSSGYEDLDMVTKETFQQCRYPVHQKDGQLVPYTLELNYTWPGERKPQAVAPTVQIAVPAAVAAPKCAHKAAWPAGAIAGNESGSAMMTVTVAADGSVLETKIIKSTGYRDLDRAAGEALKSCKYPVIAVDGVPVAYDVNSPYTWVN